MLKDTLISFLESIALCRIPVALSTPLEVGQSRPKGPAHLALAAPLSRLVSREILLGKEQHRAVDNLVVAASNANAPSGKYSFTTSMTSNPSPTVSRGSVSGEALRSRIRVMDSTRS